MDMYEEEILHRFRAEILEGIVDIQIMYADSVSEFEDEPFGSPIILTLFANISQTEDYWLEMVQCVVRKVPSFAIYVIQDIIRDLPCPTVETLNMMFGQYFRLSSARATYPYFSRQSERNICVVLACLANKLAGVVSVQIFTNNVCAYLFHFLALNYRTRLVLMSLLALEKFAITQENKNKIMEILARYRRNPLVELLQYDDSDDYIWRQIGFCARWALDNTFLIPGREPSYVSVDMTRINVIFNQNGQSFMKISPDGLEVRCDAAEFGTLRATCEVTNGSYYFEVYLITGGPMRIGLATSESPMEDSYAIGKDYTSVGYDGSTRMLWCGDTMRQLYGMSTWRPGDIIGFQFNTDSQKVYLIQNRVTAMIPLPEFFDGPQGVRKYFAAITMASYTQCRFNFGSEPFAYRIPEMHYNTFNEVGQLTPQQKLVVPRSLFQVTNSVFNDTDNACEVCYDNSANTKLIPCGHNTFCRECVSRIQLCPICRVEIAGSVEIANPV